MDKVELYKQVFMTYNVIAVSGRHSDRVVQYILYRRDCTLGVIWRKYSGFLRKYLCKILFIKPLKQLPEYRNKQSAHKTIQSHSKHHGTFEGPTAVGACARGKQHRHHSKNKGACRHHYRTETYDSGMMGSFQYRDSGLPEIHCIFHYQNCVLG